MTVLTYDRHRTELVVQADLLRSTVRGADPTTPVPHCPGWRLGELLRHVGGAHHWAESVVRTRATAPVPEDVLNDVAGYADERPEVLDAWVAEGAEGLADALRAAAPGTPVWTPGPGGNAAFWARRMLHETVVHRADASGAVGAEFTLGADVALDAVEEWLGFCTVPEVLQPQSGLPPLLGPGRSLHLRAVDAPSGVTGWRVDLTGDAVEVRHGETDERSAAVTVRAPLADLLLLLYGRRSAASERVDVHGDARLLDLWVARSGFWLRE